MHITVSLKILWGVVGLYAAMTVIDALRPTLIPVPVLVLFLLAFVLLHGAPRYRWSGILIFIVIALVVSNILEYMSILGDVRRQTSAFTTFAVPVIASFVMVVWDLFFDPSFSTVSHRWMWEQGGGYFGVPLTNYLGWFLTVYLFYQLFALYPRFRPAGRAADAPLPRWFYFQAVALYAVLGLTFVLQYPSGSNGSSTQVSNATGAVWQTGDIYQTAALTSIYTMIFIVVLTTVKLLQEAIPVPEGLVERRLVGSRGGVAKRPP